MRTEMGFGSLRVLFLEFSKKNVGWKKGEIDSQSA